MKLTLGAIGIAVQDIKRMVEFYRDVVGFEIEWDGGPFAGCRMPSGVFFNLYQRAADDDRFSYTDKMNGTFQITCGVEQPEQVDQEYQRLLNAGATSVYVPEDQSYGLRVCFVADPEGNQIEICAAI